MSAKRTTDRDFEHFLRHGRPSRPMAGSLLLGLILSFFVVAFVWAYFTEVDEVTRGQGKVVPSKSLQVVQSANGGVLESLAVTEGQYVAEGDVLMVLSAGNLEGDYLQTRQRYFALQAKISRLEAEVNDTDLTFPPEIRQQAPGVASSEMRLYQGRLLELQSQLQVLERQRFQRERELEEMRVSLRTAERGMRLAQDERSLIQPLVERGLEPKVSLLQLRRDINELQGEVTRQQQAMSRVEASIEEVEDRKTAERERYMSEALEQLSKATADAAELEEKLPSRARQVDRTTVRTPVDGIVNRLHLTTMGGVASPGDDLAEVVPMDTNLVIEAHIRPEDIAFLYPGQPVNIKLTAYDFARYGGLNGELVTIGADAVEIPQGESSAMMYPVRVRTDDSLLDADGQPLDIIPGMVAEVDILSGKRSVLDYLMEPVVKVRDRALRE